MNASRACSKDYDFVATTTDEYTSQGIACTHGCGQMAHPISVETGIRYLRVTSQCPVCMGRMVRYFDMEERAWVKREGTGALRPR